MTAEVSSIKMVKMMVLIRPFNNYAYGPFRTWPDATVYVKTRSFFEEQGGTHQDWGKAWEEVEVSWREDVGDMIEDARAKGKAIGIERAKAEIAKDFLWRG